MKPFINVFEIFGTSANVPPANSPLALWQNAWMTGWKMMDAWQQAWVPLLAPRLPGSGLPVNPLALFPNVAMHDLAATMMKNSPFAAMLPQVEAMLTPLGQGKDDPARLSMRVRLPGGPNAETVAVEALIARQQGRERAALGCLEGVQVIYPAVATPAATAAEPVSAEVLPLDVTAAAVKAARRTPAKAAPKASTTARKPTAKPAAE